MTKNGMRLENIVVLCGDANVGKTSLFRTIVGIDHDEQYTPTRIAQQQFWEAPNGLTFAIWDTSGLTDVRNLTHVFLEKIDVGVIVVDLTQRSSFDSINTWIRDIRNRNTKDTLIFVALNRVSESVINTIEVDQLLAREDIQVFEINAVTGERVRVMMETIANRWAEEKARVPAATAEEEEEQAPVVTGEGHCCNLQ